MDSHSFARHLRQRMTDAERCLWLHLRDRRLQGFKFRRQHPLGPYVLDFVCLEARLVVEADGGQHQANQHDSQRDAWLQANGFVVLRFWNNDILSNTQGVLEVLSQTLQARCEEK